MAVLDASGAPGFFDMTKNSLVNLATIVSAVADTFQWTTTAGHSIKALSASGDFTYVPAGTTPTGGTATSLEIDLSGNGSIDVTITQVSAPLTGLVAGSDDFWAAVLAGDDTIISPAKTVDAVLFGDYRNIGSGQVLVAGNDTFDGTGGIDHVFIGDASVNNGTLTAGDDVMNNAGDISVGDVDVNAGMLTAGNDIIDLALGAQFADGDVGTNQAGGTVIGGDDVITVNIKSAGKAADITGDVFKAEAGSSVTGGADRIYGGPGGDFLHGDVDDAKGAVTGGKDTVYGYGGNDILTGDANTLGPLAILTGGNDRLFGGDGNDTLHGDWATNNGGTVNAGGDDTLKGERGDDLLFGNEGNDRLFGGIGDDELHGGAGDDDLRGNGNADRMFGEDGADSMLGAGGSDRMFGGGGDDLIRGGGLGDELFGGAGNDRLLGNGSNDTLNGGSDNDKLIGGAGNDILDGGQGNDILKGVLGDDTFVFAPGGSIDRIRDYTDGSDVIDLTAFGFASLAQAKSFGTDVAGNVEFDFGAGDKLIVDNATLAIFGAGDILI